MLSHLLQALVDHPHDDDRWLILADWVEEHDDARRARLLRLHRRLLATCLEPERHPERAAWQAEVVALLAAGVQPVVPRQSVALAEGVDLTMAWIPPGTFLMGSPEDEPQRCHDETRHPVTLTRGFWLGVHPVTQRQWDVVMGENPSEFQGADLPVESVSWQDCQEFLKALNRRDGPGYRLPTEAEWEYACRAGTTTPFFVGATLTTDQANYDGNHPYNGFSMGEYREKPTPAGTFPGNAWGLCDMHGNVFEWCADWKGDYPTGRVTDPAGPPQGSGRVFRGGSWFHYGGYCRAAFRYGVVPSFRIYNLGFRLARVPSGRSFEQAGAAAEGEGPWSVA